MRALLTGLALSLSALPLVANECRTLLSPSMPSDLAGLIRAVQEAPFDETLRGALADEIDDRFSTVYSVAAATILRGSSPAGYARNALFHRARSFWEQMGGETGLSSLSEAMTVSRSSLGVPYLMLKASELLNVSQETLDRLRIVAIEGANFSELIRVLESESSARARRLRDWFSKIQVLILKGDALRSPVRHVSEVFQLVHFARRLKAIEVEDIRTPLTFLDALPSTIQSIRLVGVRSTAPVEVGNEWPDDLVLSRVLQEKRWSLEEFEVVAPLATRGGFLSFLPRNLRRLRLRLFTERHRLDAHLLNAALDRFTDLEELDLSHSRIHLDCLRHVSPTLLRLNLRYAEPTAGNPLENWLWALAMSDVSAEAFARLNRLEDLDIGDTPYLAAIVLPGLSSSLRRLSMAFHEDDLAKTVTDSSLMGWLEQVKARADLSMRLEELDLGGTANPFSEQIFDAMPPSLKVLNVHGLRRGRRRLSLRSSFDERLAGAVGRLSLLEELGVAETACSAHFVESLPSTIRTLFVSQALEKSVAGRLRDPAVLNRLGQRPIAINPSVVVARVPLPPVPYALGP